MAIAISAPIGGNAGQIARYSDFMLKLGFNREEIFRRLEPGQSFDVGAVGSPQMTDVLQLPGENVVTPVIWPFPEAAKMVAVYLGRKLLFTVAESAAKEIAQALHRRRTNIHMRSANRSDQRVEVML